MITSELETSPDNLVSAIVREMLAELDLSVSAVDATVLNREHDAGSYHATKARDLGARFGTAFDPLKRGELVHGLPVEHTSHIVTGAITHDLTETLRNASMLPTDNDEQRFAKIASSEVSTPIQGHQSPPKAPDVTAARSLLDGIFKYTSPITPPIDSEA